MLVGNKLYDSLSVFNNKNIHILPLNYVNASNNTKKDFVKGFCKNWTNTYKTFKEVIKSVKQNIIGYAIQTGIKSNIFVVDYDNKPTTNHEILQQLLDINTFYVKTPSGGYHFYFKYNKFMHATTTGKFGNIDIRSNGGCCFFGNRSDGDYILVDNDIKECPKNILSDLYEYVKIPTKDAIDKAPIKEVDVDDLINYNISSKSLLYLINHLPDKYYNDYMLWFSITTVLKKANFKNVWIDWSKKSAKFNEKDNDFIWSKIDVKKTINNLNYIVYLVNKNREEYYTPFTDIEIIHKFYNILSKQNIKKIKQIINDKYLTTDYYKDIEAKTILLIQSGLGTGKTYNTFKWAIENNHKILSIVHLTSLNDNQVSNYNKMVQKYNADFGASIKNIQSYQDLHLINNVNENSICTTINSLVKTINLIDVSEYYIYIDEIHRIISYLLHASTLNNKRRQTFKTLTKILRECKGVIGTDGDICDITIQYLEDVGLSINFIKNTYKSFNDIPVKVYNNYKNIKILIEEAVRNKTKFTMCCNTKKDAEGIKSYIMSLGVNIQDIKLYTSISGDIVSDVNVEWEDNYIIYSPSIVEGIDRTSKEPEMVFCLVSSEYTLDPEQVKQQICRNRNIKEVHIGFKKMMNKLEYSNIEDLRERFTNNIEIFKNNFHHFLDVKTNIDGDDEYTENYYSNLFIMSSYRNNLLKCNFKYNLKQFLTNAGFIVNDDWENDIGTNDNGISNDISNDLFDKDTENDLFNQYIEGSLSKSNKFSKNLEERREICNLSLKDMEKFKAILIDKETFNIYLNIRQLVKNDVCIVEKMKSDVLNEYLENYYKENIPIIIKYKSLMRKYVPDIRNIYYYQYKETDEYINDEIEMEDADFKYMTSIVNTKADKPINKKQFLNLMNKYVKNIYGKHMIMRTKKSPRDKITKNTKTHYEYDFNLVKFNDMIQLLKYSINDRNITNIDEYIIDLKKIDIENITNLDEDINNKDEVINTINKFLDDDDM